ncbi:MAG: hypothetical protein MRK00_07375 [Nitrosomonas sp.]|nr:hypothetical protein [Calditrichota bacterium]MDR4517191.1 hypothetical protein [Nitrosomonas sp.]
MNSFKKLLLTMATLPFFLGLAQSNAHAQLLDFYAQLAMVTSYSDLNQLQKENVTVSINTSSGILSDYSLNRAAVNQISMPDPQSLFVLVDSKTFDHASPIAYEPDVYALMLVGLILIGFAASRRRTYYY